MAPKAIVIEDVLAYLDRVFPSAVTVAVIANATGHKKNSVRGVCVRFARIGTIERPERGRYKAKRP